MQLDFHFRCCVDYSVTQFSFLPQFAEFGIDLCDLLPEFRLFFIRLPDGTIQLFASVCQNIYFIFSAFPIQTYIVFGVQPVIAEKVILSLVLFQLFQFLDHHAADSAWCFLRAHLTEHINIPPVQGADTAKSDTRCAEQNKTQAILSCIGQRIIFFAVFPFLMPLLQFLKVADDVATLVFDTD